MKRRQVSHPPPRSSSPGGGLIPSLNYALLAMEHARIVCRFRRRSKYGPRLSDRSLCGARGTSIVFEPAVLCGQCSWAQPLQAVLRARVRGDGGLMARIHARVDAGACRRLARKQEEGQAEDNVGTAHKRLLAGVLLGSVLD